MNDVEGAIDNIFEMFNGKKRVELSKLNEFDMGLVS